MADRILLEQCSFGPPVDRPFALIHKAFENFADVTPDTLAAVHNKSSVTYGELEAAANRLSHDLVSLGVKLYQRISLVVSRSIEMLVAILAVLKCGCQYIPLNGQVVTQKTLLHIIQDADVQLVLCLERFKLQCLDPFNPGVKVKVVDGYHDQEHQPSCRLDYDIDLADGAYIIYTSGTTGKPKGVDVSHGNVTNLVTGAPGNLGIGAGSRVAQLLSISFDMVAWENLATLLNGGTLFIRTSDWHKTLVHVDTVIATPSVLGTIDPLRYPNIKTVAIAGRPAQSPLQRNGPGKWHSSTAAGLLRQIGNTMQVTIVNTMHRQLPGQAVSIGKPVPNTSVYILDEDELPVPFGMPGIMWAGGKCVSRGYLNLPQENNRCFKPDKFTANGTFMYTTGGDVGKWQLDGTLQHLGRVDDQVKVKGFRVELNGVSAVLENYPGVELACTILFEEQLWTFYEMKEGMQATLLQAHVEASLPYYAVPFQHRCELLPRTANGKIDKRALASLARNLKVDVHVSTVAGSQGLLQSSCSNGPHRLTSSSSTASSDGVVKSLPAINIECIDYVLLPKQGKHGLRALRYAFFSLYRRFFSLALIGNLLAIIIASARAKGIQNMQVADFGTASSVNITVCILMRQDYVINAVWTAFCSVPRSTPLFIRKYCARVGIHMGGIHSGCGVAGALWFILETVLITYDVVKMGVRSPFDPVVLTFSYVPIVLLAAIIGVAHPKFRARYHNHFEATHRLLGWTLLVTFWIQTLTFIASPLTGPHQSFHHAVIHSVDFWFLFVATVSVILPWLRLRKVNVRSEVLSPHAIRLHFDYCTPIPGTAVRISERPLLGWHAFATVAKPNEKGFSLIVSNAGDWTKRQIKRAPSSLYVRGIPACGVLRIAPLFRRIILVATGSGIGPALLVILAKKVPMRIFWSTPNPEDTFGSEIVNAVQETDPNAVVHNTRTSGKPDMVAITWRLLRESNAEAVCIISNQSLTRKVVYAMETRGVPAYGAIWDL